jgi:hypothetical protein
MRNESLKLSFDINTSLCQLNETAPHFRAYRKSCRLFSNLINRFKSERNLEILRILDHVTTCLDISVIVFKELSS